MVESFVYYKSFVDAMEMLDTDEYAKLSRAINRYAIYGEEPPEMSALASAIFIMAKPQIDANNDRKSNGAKGGRPKKEETQGLENENHRLENEKPMVSENENHRLEKNKPNVNLNVNVNENENVNENNIPPKSPQGEWDYSEHSNVDNAKHILNEGLYPDSDFIKDNDLWGIIKDWMEYKDARTPKNKNHYVTERSIKSLLTEIINNVKVYGRESVIIAIEHSMGQTWQGISWDSLQKYKSQNNKVADEWEGIV